MNRKERGLQLFKWSVIIAGLLSAFLGLAVMIVLYQSAVSPTPAPQPVKVSVTIPRPMLCRHLYAVGKHYEWAECMGVGYK